jgi:hypothetical protein
MRNAVRVLLVCLLLIASRSVATADAGAVTRAQLVNGFRAATGARLTVDPRATYTGHYTALALPQSIGNAGRYGHFTIWLVTSRQEEDVTGLLADLHTGTLGAPGAASIYWEHATTMGGSPYWLAKKRYGANVVLWWYGTERRVDARFKRLHHALSAIAAT